MMVLPIVFLVLIPKLINTDDPEIKKVKHSICSVGLFVLDINIVMFSFPFLSFFISQILFFLNFCI